MSSGGYSTSSREQALLVGFEPPAELQRLAATAGAVTVGTLVQNRKKPDPKYYIGSGKVEELKALAAARGANLVIFDHELSPSQERNLEEFLGIKVIDRTELILDIFARHAKTREGRLQVELAQSEFLLTRLSGHGVLMSRLGGGIGTRGPGETKLEYDRRRIRARIAQLNKEIEKLRVERSRQREKRRRSQVPVISLVGYTNAGKSTLLNALTRADALVQDKLFTTLDPTTRRLYLPSGQVALVTDTVGFIENLPHSLVAAFRATLEEITEAALLLHVVDISAPDYERQIHAVYGVLEELRCITKPIITVFNKIDRREKKVPRSLLNKYQPAVAVSALQKNGLEKLAATIDAQLPARSASILPSAE